MLLTSWRPGSQFKPNYELENTELEKRYNTERWNFMQDKCRALHFVERWQVNENAVCEKLDRHQIKN